MKHIDDIKKKLEWEKYYSLDELTWNSGIFYTNNRFTEDFIREFADRVNWYYISKDQQLSESFMEEFEDDIDWWCISQRQILSENFIRKYANKVAWNLISMYQTLSEDFIMEFKDKVNITWILLFQKDLSEEFKEKLKKGYL